ncbi:hypothetical protein [Evansella clarkii]|uniref:hypothetical protein n=1 Tax=Evansella clarkii TaxID=79879 RepID=UPI0015A7591B|nr:hypothetical protein [Evansella clarkii]
MSSIKFTFDSRLGIVTPQLQTDWEELDPVLQEKTLAKWENVRGDIPERIKSLEQQINKLQKDLYEEENFERSCQLNSQIAELASVINDLWIWYRTGEEVKVKTHS